MSARREHRIRKLERRVERLESVWYMRVTANEAKDAEADALYHATLNGLAKRGKRKVYRPLAALFRKK